MNQDTSESWAMCEECGEQRRFVPARGGAPRAEGNGAGPQARESVEGVPGSACASCGHFRFDVVQAEVAAAAPGQPAGAT